MLEDCFKLETERLKKSWMRYDRATLRDYLVQDVEDPRINVQSILTRHFLIERLFGTQFDAVMEQELRFALMVPNYICDLLCWAPVETTDVPVPDYLMSTFQMIWREVLADEQPQHISVLEPACGSANDYRFIEAFGITELIGYTGFDLCEKNIRNARQMFPEAYFKVGNVLEIEAGEGEFDYCFVHDLFEHLSIEAMEVAIAEICRVTRKGICAGFFNMQDGERHIVRPVGDYYWNNLSMIETKAIFERYASAVQVIHVDTFLWSKFRCGDTHNKGAYILVISI